MPRCSVIMGLTIVYVFILILCCGHAEIETKLFSKEDKLYLREEAKEMFYHGYNCYMDNAYPADELMPLSCKGRWRDSEISRGDIDDILGNFSLTIIDALDTLVILGDLEEFERALKLIIKDVSFDQDIVVSLFETNIRVVGGLISGHILADHINQLYGAASWYRGELLSLAQDVATRLLPAFNTSTGIPHPRVNLRHGMNSPKIHNSRDTCTACAGTIILEFASLSRLTGEPVFEEKARQAMDYLWAQRNRGSDLVGTVLNVHSGDWIRRDSGVGAGIDSYYEYLLKAYVLLGDEGYLDRFNKHYSAVMKYVSQGPMLVDVHMHRPHTTSRNFMDSLLAFWPGLQVLKGDIKPAIETHEMLYQVIQRHNFLPEAFTTDFQVHWGQHLLRPEFLESTYLLYQATGDHYYLHAGEKVLRSLQKHAWVPCGYAAVKDVRTGIHEDRMDSFVLAETFKYLYLLFTEPSDLPIDLDEFIFTTEAHLLPLSLARLSNLTTVPLSDSQNDPTEDIDVEYSRSCPNADYLFPGHHQFAESIRRPLKNFVNNICPSRKILKRKLRASEFQSGSASHMNTLRDMGITIMSLQDGRVQLLHTSSNAKTTQDAEEGLLFMQEMIELSKLQQDQPENPPRAVTFLKPKRNISGDDRPEVVEVISIIAGPAQFGKELKGDSMISAPLVKADPLNACGKIENKDKVKDRIVIMERGDCMFIEKARRIEALGATGGIVLDHTPGSTSKSSPMFAMSGDGTDDVGIPMVFLFRGDAEVLLDALEMDPDLDVALSDFSSSELPRTTNQAGLNGHLEEIVIQAAGPTVKSTIKKYQVSQDSPMCSEERYSVSDNEDVIEDLFQEKDTGGSAAMGSTKEVQTDTEINKAILDYLNTRLKHDGIKGDPAIILLSFSILAELHTLLTKKLIAKTRLSESLRDGLEDLNDDDPVKIAIEKYMKLFLSHILLEEPSAQSSETVSASPSVDSKDPMDVISLSEYSEELKRMPQTTPNLQSSGGYLESPSEENTSSYEKGAFHTEDDEESNSVAKSVAFFIENFREGIRTQGASDDHSQLESYSEVIDLFSSILKKKIENLRHLYKEELKIKIPSTLSFLGENDEAQTQLKSVHSDDTKDKKDEL